MEIKPYSKNAKKHPKKQIEQVANSIREFGMNQPIVVDKNGVIIVGHGRFEALKHLGMEVKDEYIKVVDLTEEQAAAYRLADNKLNESEWDMDLVIEELKGLSEPMIELTGFDSDLIIEPEEKDDEVPETPEEPRSKLGDLYEIGGHRVLCGDSTKIEDVERLMDGHKADMVFTDPPYGMDLDTDYSKMSGNEGSGKKYDSGIVDEFSPDMIDSIMSIDAKETFIWGADYFAEYLPKKNEGSWLVWDKRESGETGSSVDKRFGSMFELCWSKNRHKREIVRFMWAGMMKQSDYDSERSHPTQKPAKLSAIIIQKFGESNDTVLDLFLGSGSTLIACEQTDRTCYGMELDPKYVDVIVQRYVEYVENPKVVKNGVDETELWQKTKKM